MWRPVWTALGQLWLFQPLLFVAPVSFGHVINQESHSLKPELSLCHALVPRSEWNPKTDKHLPHNYDVEDFVEGKRRNKMKLQVWDGWGARVGAWGFKEGSWGRWKGRARGATR